MSIQVRFIVTDGIEDSIIKFCTWIGGQGNAYTHCEIVVPNEGYLGSNTPTGGTKGGVYLRPFNYYPKGQIKHETVGTVQCSDAIAEQIITRCKTIIVAPYDYAAVAGDLLHLNWSQKNSYDCSAYVLWSFMQDLPLLDMPRYKWVSPETVSISPLFSLQVMY